MCVYVFFVLGKVNAHVCVFIHTYIMIYITNFFFLQADVEVTFSFASLDKAETYDPKWVNAQDLCAQKGSKLQGGVGPFGLLTLASQNFEEFTPVFFRIFKGPVKHVVLLCSDATRLVYNTNWDENF